MQDVSRVTGDPVIIKPSSKGGREFIVRGACFDDLGLLQAELLREKREAKLDVAAMMVSKLDDPAERTVILDKAMADAEKIAYVSMAELLEFVGNEKNIVTFLWCLLERQYPGEFNRNSLFEMILAGELQAESIGRLISSLIGTPQGNLTGQKAASPTIPASGDGALLSGNSSSHRKAEGSASRRRRRVS